MTTIINGKKLIFFNNAVPYTKPKPTRANDLQLRKINTVKNVSTFRDNESLLLKELPGRRYMCMYIMCMCVRSRILWCL